MCSWIMGFLMVHPSRALQAVRPTTHTWRPFFPFYKGSCRGPDFPTNFKQGIFYSVPHPSALSEIKTQFCQICQLRCFIMEGQISHPISRCKALWPPRDRWDALSIDIPNINTNINIGPKICLYPGPVTETISWLIYSYHAIPPDLTISNPYPSQGQQQVFCYVHLHRKLFFFYVLPTRISLQLGSACNQLDTYAN